MGKGCAGNMVKKTKMKFLLTIPLLLSIAFAQIGIPKDYPFGPLHGVTTEDLQIKADGKTDDLAALKAWAKTGGILPAMPYSLVRITNTCAIPKEVSANLYIPDGKLIKDSSQYAKSTPAVTLDLNFCTIWLDNPDKTKAVFAYNAWGRINNNTGLPYDNNSGCIKNGTLRGVGIGISTAYTGFLRIENINFQNFKTGLVLNNASNLTGTNLKFSNCERAEFDIRSHSSSFRNIVVEYCKKGFEIRSNNMIIEGYSAINCNIGLHVAAGNNKISGVVLETTREGEAQLLIGDSTGAKVDGNVFEAITISAPNLRAIKWLKTAGMMSINGGGAQSTLFEVVGQPTVWVMNFLGTLPSTITKKL